MSQDNGTPISDAPKLNQSTYLLQRELGSSIRLSHQHFLWERQLGWNLHPTISAAVAEHHHAAIADVACGNGIWLMDESQKHDTAVTTFHGFDISDEQFPTQDTWPENIKFSILDALAPLPGSLHGQFDVVHCRLVTGAVSAGDPKPFLNTFLAMLKPGGYLQWDEVNCVTPPCSIKNAVEKKWYGFIPRIIAQYRPDWTMNFSWIDQLPSVFEEYRMTEIEEVRAGWPPSRWKRYWSDSEFTTIAEIARGVGAGESVLKEIEEGRESGVNIHYELRVVVGRKSAS